MPDIQHYLTIDAPADRVFDAVASTEGIGDWWTPAISGGAAEGESFHVEFPTGGFADFQVVAVDPARSVTWRCVGNDANEWLGTTIRFEVQPDGTESSVLRFSHLDWAAATDFYASCNFFWGRHMTRVAKLAMTGESQTSHLRVPAG